MRKFIIVCGCSLFPELLLLTSLGLQHYLQETVSLGIQFICQIVLAVRVAKLEVMGCGLCTFEVNSWQSVSYLAVEIHRRISCVKYGY